MPLALRKKVNLMMRDNAKSAAIIQFLKSRDISGLNEMNLSRWRHGGYRHWLENEERKSELKHDAEFALDIVRLNPGNKINKAAQILAASQLLRIIRDFNLGGLKNLLKNKPEYYAPIVNALVKITKSKLDLEKFEFNAAKAALKIWPSIKRISHDTSMSDADKVQEVRRRLFGIIAE